jgi:hypothetical protein
MTIRAIIRDGRIQPIEPIPPDWAEGQELVVEEPGVDAVKEKVDQWANELEAAAARLPTEEHDQFRCALEQIERESKEAVRREWQLPS